VRGLPVRALLTIGRAADAAKLGPIPENVHVEQWVPQADVLGEAAALVCHGGSGTPFGALAAGLPIVFGPLFADQPVNARLVSAAGGVIDVFEHGGHRWHVAGPPTGVAQARAAVLGDA